MKADKSNLYGYNKNLKGFARANRSAMTKAEACLWEYVLRARQMKGYQFRRQRSVLNYIADFMCKELMLILEVYGMTHHYPDKQENDRVRQKELELAGFAVLRIDNEDVLTAINSVNEKLKIGLNVMKKTSPLILLYERDMGTPDHIRV